MNEQEIKQALAVTLEKCTVEITEVDGDKKTSYVVKDADEWLHALQKGMAMQRASDA